MGVSPRSGPDRVPPGAQGPHHLTRPLTGELLAHRAPGDAHLELDVAVCRGFGGCRSVRVSGAVRRNIARFSGKPDLREDRALHYLATDVGCKPLSRAERPPRWISKK